MEETEKKQECTGAAAVEAETELHRLREELEEAKRAARADRAALKGRLYRELLLYIREALLRGMDLLHGQSQITQAGPITIPFTNPGMVNGQVPAIITRCPSRRIIKTMLFPARLRLYRQHCITVSTIASIIMWTNTMVC